MWSQAGFNVADMVNGGLQMLSLATTSLDDADKSYFTKKIGK